MTWIDDETRVRHMLGAARRAQTLTAGRARTDLVADDILGLAVVRLLEILGEAARGVSSALRANYPEIPWQRIIGTRNRVIHAYFNVDMDIIWGILTDELPDLIDHLERVCASEDWS